MPRKKMNRTTEGEPLASPPGEPDAGESPDFADEHDDTTVGDGLSDHSDSGELETESPRGLGGMDLRQDPLREL